MTPTQLHNILMKHDRLSMADAELQRRLLAQAAVALESIPEDVQLAILRADAQVGGDYGSLAEMEEGDMVALLGMDEAMAERVGEALNKAFEGIFD